MQSVVFTVLLFALIVRCDTASFAYYDFKANTGKGVLFDKSIYQKNDLNLATYQTGNGPYTGIPSITVTPSNCLKTSATTTMPTQDFSVSMWYRRGSASTLFEIGSRAAGQYAGAAVKVSGFASPILIINVYTATYSFDINVNSALNTTTTDAWQHIVILFHKEDGKMDLYFNGVYFDGNKGTLGPIATSGQFALLANLLTATPITNCPGGTISTVLIMNRIIKPNEVNILGKVSLLAPFDTLGSNILQWNIYYTTYSHLHWQRDM
jgi:hypothetical protein